MAPSEKTIKEHNLKDGAGSLSGEEVVISGISGVFPNSENVVDFMNNLYDKVDMVTSADPKWNLNNPDLPKYVGQISGMYKFDAQFFGVSFQLASVLDPMGRKLMEHAYGAFLDAGISPQAVRGTRIGVFIGTSITDLSTNIMYNVNRRSDFVINGGSKAMFANRISYWIDGKGPSFCLDFACASSTACLDLAYKSIKSGECDAAIVGGCNYAVHPLLTLNMRKAGMLCLDGKTKCFDKNADGYVRADAVNVLFLQKAKDAHRIYAEVYHAKGNYNLKPDAEFLPIRKSEDIEKFYNEFYSETDVDPKNIEYIEANGAAILQADENELKAIGNIFAKDTTVKVGSVKSNMGNSETASGVVAVTKLCLAYHKGKLPANLHYNEPQDQIPAIREGRVKVLVDHADFDRGYTAVNNFSFTGANYHVVLKGHYKKKNRDKYKSQIPHLVLASGRQESCVQKIIDIMKSHPIDPEEIGLLHKVYEHDVSGHTGRGYTILAQNEKNETVSLGESVDYYPGVKRPLWFVFSGMGSQWAGMGADLMRIPIFAAAIHKCHKVLEPKGLDLLRIVTERDNSIFDNILNAFVGIGAVQIGLIDVIKAMGIDPDYIIGHSLGEMACAYFDDTFTAEELILSTYSRGKVCLETDLIRGSMAAVGIGYKALVGQCPPDIDIACHNSFESTTISGPAEKMTEFVGELTKQGIFAKEVPCANIAYHSRYIEHCGPELLRRLREVIKSPKKRSSKWISTSVPQNEWDGLNAVYSSAEYHTNNLLKPVLFEESAKSIPDNAVIVEIAPHGLLQAILKRSHSKCTLIPLTRRGTDDSVKFLLDAIGKIYQTGINPKVDALYPKIEFPVSTETPLLSHYVEWEHSEDWPRILSFDKKDQRIATSRDFPLSIYDDDYKFLEGHVRNDLIVLPESALLVLVWETLAMNLGINYREQSVVFSNITFFCEVIIKSDVPSNLLISINRGSETFEVSQNDKTIASGEVNFVKILKFNKIKEFTESNNEEIKLTKDDIYRILKSRGYSYKDKFQCIQLSNLDRSEALVQWDNNWITFLDSLIQLKTVARKYEGVSTPKFIRKLRISIVEQEISNVELFNGVNCYTAKYNELLGVVRCAGVELVDVTFIDKPIIEHQPDVLVSRGFYPHYATDKVDLKTALLINLQVVAENTTKNSIKVTQIVTSNKNINCLISEISDNIPNIQIDVTSVIDVDTTLDATIDQYSDHEKANVFIIENLLVDEKKLETLRNLSKDSFVLALENEVPKLQGVMKELFSVVTSMSDGKQILILLKRQNPKDVTYISVNCDNKLDWVSRVYDELNKTKRVVLVSERQPYCGALGFVQKLRNDGVDNISLVAIDDFHAPHFSAKLNVYKNQLEQNLAVNIFQKGEWGGLYYSPVSTKAKLRNVILTSQTGGLDDLTWIEAPTASASKKLVQVSYAGISLKDTEIAISNRKRQEKLGMDFSGINTDGDRVMGLVSGGALGSTVEADPDILWPVPDHWSLQDAATVPLPYAIAYYCLTQRSQVLRDQTIFVTGGAGALGQAVIALCLSLDCTVFTTVSSINKKKMLLRLFPQLDENKICHIRTDSFLTFFKTYTIDINCDFVINCASGSMRETAMNCITRYGKFLDLSSYDMYENRDVGLSFLSKDRSYITVDFSSIFKPENAAEKKNLQRIIAEGIANGTVRPISRVEYSPMEITKAFRLLSSSKHVGKVLIRMRSPEILTQGFDVIPRIIYDSKGVYIVICDETGLGIELADRLIKMGARKLVLHSKSKVSGYWQSKFVSWNKNDVAIKISTDNLQTQQGCTKMLMDAAKVGPVKGIFVVPDIDTKTNEDKEDFVLKFNKTVNAVINLNMMSKTYCNDLRHFVILTTPTNSTSNEFVFSVLEKIYQGRVECGFPALFVRTAQQKSNPEEILHPKALSALFNAMETSLKLKYNNVLFCNLNKNNKGDYLKKLENILGVTDIDKVLHYTVDQILNEVSLVELQTLIRKSFEIDYSTTNIQRMTIESLKNIGETKTEKSKAVTGLSTFYPSIDDEEKIMLTSHPIVPMPTLVDPGTDSDLDPNETYVTLIPGFEGSYQIFNSVAKGLKVQAVAVQLALDFAGNNIPEMAANIRKLMKTKFETKSKFYLMGYSFGVNIAFELAALLEKEGHIGVVYCLDSSPDALKIQLKSHLGDLTCSELENVVLNHLFTLMTGQISEELYQYLEQANNWSEKVDACMYKLRGLANYSNQYKSSILNSALKRIQLAMEYTPEFKLQSEIVLIRGVFHPQSEDLGEDYNLSKYSKQPVKVFHIEADHASAPYDSRVSNIVNSMLDSSLIEKYKKKNLCQTYYVNSE